MEHSFQSDFAEPSPPVVAPIALEPAASPLQRHLPIDHLPTVERGVILREAHMATLAYAAATPEATALVSSLTEMTIEAEVVFAPRRRRRRTADRRSFEQTIGALLADLIVNCTNEPAYGFCYRSKDRAAFTDTLASSKNFDKVMRLWEAIGLIETGKGFQGRVEFGGREIKDKGWATRLRPTVTLLTLAAERGVTPENALQHFTKRHEVTFPVTLKEKSTWVLGKQDPGRKVQIKKNATANAIAAEVREINAVMEAHEHSLPEPPQFIRCFNCADDPNFDWNKGGRLFAQRKSSYQAMKSSERAKLLIDGEAVAEIDVKASHLTIYYALRREFLDLSCDPYEIDGVPRDVVKLIITTAFGKGKLPTRWPQGALKQKKGSDEPPIAKGRVLRRDLAAILDRHPILRDLEASGLDWADLQYVEAEILIQAMLKLAREDGIPSLPVHDSLIVREGDVEKAMEVLSDGFEERVGIRPSLKVKAGL